MIGLDVLLASYALSGPLADEAAGRSFSGVSTDSRQCQPGQLFVALVGEQHDGHDYVEAALERGCRAAVVQRDRFPTGRRRALGCRSYEWNGREWLCAGPKDAAGVLILVPDTLSALQRLAAAWRARFSPLVVGITGSVGKSGTKELMAAVLGRHYAVLKSPQSYNNEIGLPLTLLELRAEHEVVVLEMGTYGPGEIALLTDIARPQVGVVTNVSASHLERMETLEVIAQAKSELPAALPDDGLAVLNGDESLVLGMAAQSRAPVLSYGLGAHCAVRAKDVRGRGLAGISFGLHWGPEQRELHCVLPGRHNVYTALAAVAVGRTLGVAWSEVEAGLLDPAARLRLLYVPGPEGSILVDDTYNASPLSCRAALDLLNELPGPKIAVLADMLELGPLEEEGHRQVGCWAAEVVEELFLLGERAAWMGAAALERGLLPEQVHCCTSSEQLLRLLRPRLAEGVVVLFKGSRAMGLDRMVAALRREES
ncbi:MAG: UDP-N-acetylmuramoyl-tripeptide--D-alanyl-D-alanine ligase [Chloroflexia bacterium]|nr:UDP-N-acetylmuramoyl-tripeptide--D-alanyl-D-alanine ligase [Chloroflexia bacterium]